MINTRKTLSILGLGLAVLAVGSIAKPASASGLTLTRPAQFGAAFIGDYNDDHTQWRDARQDFWQDNRQDWRQDHRGWRDDRRDFRQDRRQDFRDARRDRHQDNRDRHDDHRDQRQDNRDWHRDH